MSVRGSLGVTSGIVPPPFIITHRKSGGWTRRAFGMMEATWTGPGGSHRFTNQMFAPEGSDAAFLVCHAQGPNQP